MATREEHDGQQDAITHLHARVELLAQSWAEMDIVDAVDTSLSKLCRVPITELTSKYCNPFIR